MKKILFIIFTLLISISLYSCSTFQKTQNEKTELSSSNILDYVKIDISFDKVTAEEKKTLSYISYDLYSSVTVKISPKDDYVFSNASISYELRDIGNWKRVNSKVNAESMLGIISGTIQLDKSGYGEQTINIRCNHTSKTYKPSNEKWTTNISSAEGKVSAPGRSSTQDLTQNDYYIVNKTSKKFHLPSCTSLPSSSNSYKVSVNDINKSAYSNLSPCGICNPLDSTPSNTKSQIPQADLFALAIIAFYVIMLIVLKVSANKTTIENIDSSPFSKSKLLKFITISFWIPNAMSVGFISIISPLWITIVCAILYLLFSKRLGTFFDAIVLIVAIVYYIFFATSISFWPLILLAAGMAYTLISAKILNNEIIFLAVQINKLKKEASKNNDID